MAAVRVTGTMAWRATRAEASRILTAVAADIDPLTEQRGIRRRGRLHAWGVGSDLHRLARAARALGLSSLSSIVMRMAERLEPCLRAGELGRRDAEVLRRLAEHCRRYLEDPTDVKAAAAMVDELAADPLRAAGRWERIHLLQGAIEEGAEAVGLVSGRANGARYHRLTGLLDRNSLHAVLREILRAAAPARAPVGVMSIGIAGVEDIVDSLGPEAGAAVVARVAAQLIRAAPGGAAIGRFGPDHFVVACSGLTALELTQEASHLVALICRSHSISGHPVSVTARIGLAMAGQHGRSAAQLLGNADAALHDARARKLYTTQFFAPQMRHAALRRVSLEAQLRTAIERGSFELHYQPKLSLRTGRLCGLEALVRWPASAQGPIPPAEFIPIAERSGLIVPLGDWVIDAACRQMSHWRHAGAPGVPLAINLSAVQLCSQHTQERINRALQGYGLPPHMLELEITESALMRDAGAALGCLNELGRLGVRLAVDDFGTGYSNLSQLIRLPLAAIKIDRSLIAGIATHARDAAIMRAIIDIARTLGARVVAEGVESTQQRDVLAAAGCDEYQGFLIAKPMDAAQLEAWLVRHTLERRLA